MRGQVISSSSKLFDTLLLTGSFAVAALSHFQATGAESFTQFLQLRVKLGDLIIFVSLLALWHLSFAAFGMYSSKRMSTRKAEAMDGLKATTLCALIVAFASFVLHFRWVTPGFVAIFWGCSTAAVVSSRLIARTLLQQLRMHGQDLRNMLIVGSNQRAIDFAKSIETKPELGYRILGFADDDWHGVAELERHGWPLVCSFDDLGSYLRRNVVDEVVIAVPLRSFHDLASSVAAMCEQQGIVLRTLPNLFNLQQNRPVAEEFGGSALITHYSGNAEGWPTMIKRALDFTLSLLLLIVLAPLLVLTAILIKLTSPGPVFFIQKRVGLNKRVFHICKFRTMVIDAERRLQEIEHLNEVSGPVFKIKNDPRLTPIGKLLRQSSIDELPQLFNVLKGDMSLVGPRPLQLRDYELFTENGQDWQRCRFSVRPGITCLWQVNGRSALPFHKWMELDLQYVRNWSLWLDLQILAKTIPAVLRGSGAA